MARALAWCNWKQNSRARKSQVGWLDTDGKFGPGVRGLRGYLLKTWVSFTEFIMNTAAFRHSAPCVPTSFIQETAHYGIVSPSPAHWWAVGRGAKLAVHMQQVPNTVLPLFSPLNLCVEDRFVFASPPQLMSCVTHLPPNSPHLAIHKAEEGKIGSPTALWRHRVVKFFHTNSQSSVCDIL